MKKKNGTPCDCKNLRILKRQSGVTLVELMITLAVAAILMSMALPSFQGAIIRSRLNTSTNEFLAAINFARSEAVKLGRTVKLCKSQDSASCSTDDDVNWEAGWIALADSNGDGSIDSDDTSLRSWSALPDTYTLRSVALPDEIEYNAQGAAKTTGTFAICHDSDEAGAKVIEILSMRPLVAQDADDIGSCESP